MNQMDEPVFVVDLRDPPSSGASDPADTPLGVEETIATVAIVGRDGAVTLRTIRPTRDERFLNALARLLRVAEARGESVRRVAERDGGEYERRLLFERRLPAWALDYGAR